MLQALAASLNGVSGLLPGLLMRPALADIILRLLGERGRIFDPLIHNSVSPTILQGSDKINVIPRRASVELDGRLLPGFEPEDLIAELRHIVSEEVDLDVVQYDPGPADTDMGLFETLADVLQQMDPGGGPVPLLLSGVTDARFFSRLEIQSYGFTPMALPEAFNSWIGFTQRMSVFRWMLSRLARMQFINSWVALASERVCHWENYDQDRSTKKRSPGKSS